MPAFSRFTALAESLPPTVPFVGPETQERARGEKFVARLGANESGFGPAPSVIEAITREAQICWRYADPENHDLRVSLGAHLGLAPERVVVGEGIDGLLGLIVRLIVEPGGAAALAGLRSGSYRPAPGERVGVIVCGANADPAAITGTEAG